MNKELKKGQKIRLLYGQTIMDEVLIQRDGEYNIGYSVQRIKENKLDGRLLIDGGKNVYRADRPIVIGSDYKEDVKIHILGEDGFIIENLII